MVVGGYEPYDRTIFEKMCSRYKDQMRKNNYVRHQETCPECGRKLVNVYSRATSDGWKCLTCWQKRGYFLECRRGRTK